MCKNFSKLFIVMSIGFASVTMANTAMMPSGSAMSDLIIQDSPEGHMQLEIRQMPLAQVLDQVARKTHVTIHYSELPSGLVTVSCAGTALKQVLECLLDKKADIIVRFEHVPGQAGNNEQVAEAWILGSGLSYNASNMDSNASSTDSNALLAQTVNNSLFTANQNAQSTVVESEQSDELVKMAQSKNSSEREEAIASLLAEGDINDPSVKATLETALTDLDAGVRAQAISSLAHMKGSDATGAIQDALHDESVDVRLMAVDSIAEDAPLLQQALQDSDETVRMLAKVKLEVLAQENNVVE